MRLQITKQDRRSVPLPSRRAAPASPATPRRGRSGLPRRAKRQGRLCADRPRRTPLQPAPGRRSGRLEQVAPHFPLTLRAMFGTRQVSTPVWGRSLFALSVLALLAMGCFPVFAQADSSGIQYSDAPPTATGGHEIPSRSAPPAHSSKANGGPAVQGGGNSADSSGKGSSAGVPSSKSGGTTNGDGTGQQGSPGQGSAGGSDNPSSPSARNGEATSSTSDDSSSPLVPILIAIAVLAAISIGVVMMRQRRRRGSGVPISPKAS
jgi:hypothetical protein